MSTQSILALISLILALILFALATFKVALGGVPEVSAGLFFFALAFLFDRLPAGRA